MIAERIQADPIEASVKTAHFKRNTHHAQELIYQFLLDIVKVCSAEDVLKEFKTLFIHHIGDNSSNILPALYELTFANNEEDFRHTLKRSCYILVNNWETTRQHQAIQDLIELFNDPILHRATTSPTLGRLRTWLINFINSTDYQDLKAFADRYEKPADGPTPSWANRYASYLLMSQYEDDQNPAEQRDAARTCAARLKNQFKFDLAMYTAKSQSLSMPGEKTPPNPTGLGAEVLRLIKLISLRRGAFSYTNLASLFLKQTAGIAYIDFKKNLYKYLTFSLPQMDFGFLLQQKIEQLYPDHNQEIVSDALILRTCNRIISYLTTEDRKSPSHLFCILTSSNPFSLILMLMKLMLLCRTTCAHLEARIGDLIRYYDRTEAEITQNICNFFEVFNVAFVIHTGNVEYSVVPTRIPGNNVSNLHSASIQDLESYRIFSQLKNDAIAQEA